MNGNEAIEASEAAKKVLEEHGLDVQELVLHAAVQVPEDDKFDYVVCSYTDPVRVEPSVRSRLFDSLVSTAEGFGFAPESDD